MTSPQEAQKYRAGSLTWWRLPFSMLLIAFMVVSGVLATGCARKSAVGEINDRASVAVLQYEQIEAGVSGVVYREVNDFNALVAATKTPLLLVFYNLMSEVNAQVMPLLEQLADDEQGRITIVWIDASRQAKLAESFNVDILPQFTVMVEATVKRTLVGFDSQGPEKIEQLIAPYLQS